MRFVPYFLMLTATQIVAGALLTGSRRRRIIGACVAFAAIPIPYLMPNQIPLLRAMLALGIAMTCLRSVDLARENSPRSLLFRILHVAIPFDTRHVRARSPGELRELVRTCAHLLLYLSITVAAFFVTRDVAPTFTGATRLAIRWASGAAFVYALSDFAYGFAGLLFEALGFEIYDLHRAPAAALSIREFWGVRWNRTVNAWFREHCFTPLARRRMPRLGVLASFGVSAILHAYLVVVAIGVPMAVVMLGYFLLHAVLVFVEVAIDSTRWNKAFSRVWTLTLLAATSPMFVEPALRVIGI